VLYFTLFILVYFMFIKPILYSISACFIWGLIFIVPLCLGKFHCVDIVLGRYLCFGILSFFFFAYSLYKKEKLNCLTYWKEASLCALIMNFGYYIALTLGMRSSNPSLIALIVGTAPISISACQLKAGGLSFRTLIGPSIGIFIGIVLVNVEALQADWQHFTLGQYLQGIMYGILALAAWTWYVIYNTSFLQKHPHVNPSHWTVFIGVITLGFTLIGVLGRLPFLDEADKQLFSFTTGEGIRFILGTLALGALQAASFLRPFRDNLPFWRPCSV
jgi:drug/metabolite transporter (DMT)-like permease